MNTEDRTFEAQPESTVPESTHTVAPPAGPLPQLSPEDEKLWATLAHLSVLLNLVTGFLGVGVALLIHLIYRDRSRYVAFQSLQALIFQLVFWAGGGVLIGLLWGVVGLLSSILVGIFLIPFAILGTLVLALFPVIAVIYGVIGGIRCNKGTDFRYWLISDWALALLG